MGEGDQWVKPGNWELGDHVTELCFDSKLEWVKVCSSLRIRLQFLGMFQWWDFLSEIVNPLFYRSPSGVLI